MCSLSKRLSVTGETALAFIFEDLMRRCLCKGRTTKNVSSPQVWFKDHLRQHQSWGLLKKMQIDGPQDRPSKSESLSVRPGRRKTSAARRVVRRQTPVGAPCPAGCHGAGPPWSPGPPLPRHSWDAGRPEGSQQLPLPGWPPARGADTGCPPSLSP